jgi:AraC-like DNA-binding protein
LHSSQKSKFEGIIAMSTVTKGAAKANSEVRVTDAADLPGILEQYGCGPAFCGWTAPLSGRLQRDEFVLRMDRSGKADERRFFPTRKLNLRKMQQALENAAKSDIFEHPTLSQIASRLGCDQTTLVRRFPDLAKQVKELYKQSCAARKETREKQLELIVRKATMDIHNSGDYPSQYKVRQALPRSIDMRDPPANKAWKQTLVELGFGRDQERLTTEA